MAIALTRSLRIEPRANIVSTSSQCFSAPELSGEACPVRRKRVLSSFGQSLFESCSATVDAEAAYSKVCLGILVKRSIRASSNTLVWPSTQLHLPNCVYDAEGQIATQSNFSPREQYVIKSKRISSYLTKNCGVLLLFSFFSITSFINYDRQMLIPFSMKTQYSNLFEIY